MKVVSERREQKWRGPAKRGPRGRQRPRWQLCKLFLSFILHFDLIHILYYVFSVFSLVIAAYGPTQKTARDSGEKGGMTLWCAMTRERMGWLVVRCTCVRMPKRRTKRSSIDHAPPFHFHPRQSFFTKMKHFFFI